MKNELLNYQNKMEDNFQEAFKTNGRLIRSYGRIKSRKLSDHKKFLLENNSLNYEIVETDFSLKSLQSQQNQGSSKIKTSFEIGFGFGDFLFEKARLNQDQIFFGCEPHINGVVNVLAKLENTALSNIKISRQDARELLNKFDDNFFDEIYILFPDPWPKAKHFKRRLINVDFLDNLLARKLKSRGKIIIATDHDSYKTWILSEILKSQQFNWQATCQDDWQKFPSDWVETKYQKKAKLEGRISVIFNLEKNN